MKNTEDRKKYFNLGITAFAVIAACICLYFLITNWEGFIKGLTKSIGIFAPFIWGLAIAFLLRPVLRLAETYVTSPLGEKLFKKDTSKAFGFSRSIAILLSVLFMLLVLTLLLRLILPQLYASVENLVKNSGTFYKQASEWASRVLDRLPQFKESFMEAFSKISESITEWAKTTLMPSMSGLLTNITSGVMSVFKGAANFVVGVIASIYILYNKEAISAGAKKFIYSILSLDNAEKLIKGVRFSDGVFSDFLSGTLLDSSLVGLTCYIGCLILKLPYPILIAVIVGTTNLIPFFGPFIGAIPSAFIIFTVSPSKALVFIIFILVLQQIEGNIFAPKILGGKVGLSGFWIMFAIISAGGIFGFGGMLVGVPVFTIIYAGIGVLVNRKLEKNGLPTETAFYESMSYIDPISRSRVEKPPEPTREEKRRARAEKKAADKKKSSEKGNRMYEKVTAWRRHIKSSKDDDKDNENSGDDENQE